MYCEMRSTPSVVISPLLQVALPRETGLPSPGKRRCRRGWARGGHHDKRLSKRQLFILTFILCNHNPLLGKKELRALGKKEGKGNSTDRYRLGQLRAGKTNGQVPFA